MLKKSFFIVLPIMFFAFYGCSSMKHSTVVLYVSHKVEGPLYMPEAEPPVETRNPQIEREIAERENQAKQESESKKPTRSRAAQDSQANQNSAPAQTNETKPTRGSRATQDSQANQNSEPAQTTETKKPTRGSKATQDSQANQNNEPAQASETKKSANGSQSSTTQTNQAAQESKPSQSRPSRGTPTAETEEKQPTSAPTQERRPATTRRRANQDNQATATNTYQNGYQTRTLPRGELLILENPIRFAFEKYYIGSDYDDTVQYVAEFMKQNTNFQLVVEGHTDRVGEYDFNSGLSLRRSRSAISKLVRAGVKRNRLIESGVSYRFSEYNFNRLNRRVEFIIIRSPEELAKYQEGIKEE